MPKASEKAIKLAGEVLAKIAAYDPQFSTPNPATLQAWAEHIGIRNPEREDMLAAVTRFYEHNTDCTVKPLPASISSISRQIKQERMLHTEYTPPPDKSVDPEPPGLPGVEKITLAEWERRHGAFPRLAVGRKIPEAEVQDAMPVNPLRVPCPYCKSSAGFACTVPGSQHHLTKHRAHPSRMELAVDTFTDA